MRRRSVAKFISRASVQFKATFEITESELRALDGLAGYGDDAFLKVFKEGLGAHYIENHEAGLRSFLKTVRDQTPGVISSIDKAREKLRGDS
jgi:hypothetical protein